MGVGTADADARSTRANLEAEAITMYCESQRRRERMDVCILTPLRWSPYRRVIKGRLAPQLGSQAVMVISKVVWKWHNDLLQKSELRCRPG